MSIPDDDVILEGSLKRCKKSKLFKSKWIERYFVLYCRDRGRSLFAIDEYKSSRKNELKKRFKLEIVVRVESNLSLSDPSVLCTSGHNPRRDDTLHSIFGIGFRVQNVLKQLYLVAKNDEEMALWVNEICKICELHKQHDEGDASQAGDSSISGMSMSSQSLDMSIIEQQQQFAENPKTSGADLSNIDESEDRMGLFNFGGYRMRPISTRAYHSSVRKKSIARSETVAERRKYSSLPNTPSEDTQNAFVKNDKLYANAPVTNQQQQFKKTNSDNKKYIQMNQFKSVNSQPSNPNYNNLPEPLESRSETSSMYSSRRTEDDSVSYTSGPPIPPPRSRYAGNGPARFVKLFHNGQVNRLHMIPASTSMSQVIRVEDAEDSSGETLKIGPSSHTEKYTASFEGIPIYEKNGRTLIRRAPPPVDRSNKPKNLRGEDEGTRYKKNNAKENSNYSNSTFSTTKSNFSNKTTNYISEASKRRNLDYFEPTQLVENSSSSTMAAASTRSPTPSDIEYISVDVDRTLAFKQLRRAAQSTD
ncbi:hypothetical protein GCK72_019289 [Caenorhabditis remanei]|uniref:PH domain-containing protein n=1 Tax=Caenorhabditis remanei TaxID=31234 RepID=A0A6A5GDC8_CAERE|nr:hypothetical protein GCK72_019289 [Caenorhabditis remanei]KAF1752734.1 hypothetical protein GCK72_019289 [Caenorhabditis remanei]